jgi:zinc transporter ZupT
LLPEASSGLLEVFPNYPVSLTLAGVGLITVLVVEQLVAAYSAKSREGAQHRHHSISLELPPTTFKGEQETQREKDDFNLPCDVDIYCAHNHQQAGADVMYGHDHQFVHHDDEMCTGHDHGHGHSHGHRNELSFSHDHNHHVVQNDCDSDCEKGKEMDTVCSAPHCHDHDHAAMAFDEFLRAKSIRDLFTAYALEMSTAIHSVIIGVGLGALTHVPTINVLLVALCFHQFLEGLGLGSVLVGAQHSMGTWKVLSFVMIFTLVVPVGVIIGIFTSGNETRTTEIMVQGILTSFAAGAMLYSALIELTAGTFNRPDLENRLGLKSVMLTLYVIGFGSMAVVGIWA